MEFMCSHAVVKYSIKLKHKLSDALYAYMMKHVSRNPIKAFDDTISNGSFVYSELYSSFREHYTSVTDFGHNENKNHALVRYNRNLL